MSSTLLSPTDGGGAAAPGAEPEDMYAKAISSSMQLSSSWGYKNGDGEEIIFEVGSRGSIGAQAGSKGAVVLAEFAGRIDAFMRTQGQDTRTSNLSGVSAVSLGGGKTHNGFTGVLYMHCGCTAHSHNLLRAEKNAKAEAVAGDTMDTAMGGAIPLLRLPVPVVTFLTRNTFSNVGANFSMVCLGRVDANSFGTGARGGSLICGGICTGKNAASCAINLLKVRLVSHCAIGAIMLCYWRNYVMLLAQLSHMWCYVFKYTPPPVC